jgi:hypothetical protein
MAYKSARSYVLDVCCLRAAGGRIPIPRHLRRGGDSGVRSHAIMDTPDVSLPRTRTIGGCGRQVSTADERGADHDWRALLPRLGLVFCVHHIYVLRIEAYGKRDSRAEQEAGHVCRCWSSWYVLRKSRSDPLLMLSHSVHREHSHRTRHRSTKDTTCGLPWTAIRSRGKRLEGCWRTIRHLPLAPRILVLLLVYGIGAVDVQTDALFAELVGFHLPERGTYNRTHQDRGSTEQSWNQRRLFSFDYSTCHCLDRRGCNECESGVEGYHSLAGYGRRR